MDRDRQKDLLLLGVAAPYLVTWLLLCQIWNITPVIKLTILLVLLAIKLTCFIAYRCIQ